MNLCANPSLNVSILMNCYNSEKYLDETLASLFQQTYENWTLVFIDNCSTDRSNKILDHYREDTRVNYFKTPHHMTLGQAREYGIQFCTGDLICFLDTDDIWVPQKLEKQVDLMNKYTDVQLIYTGYFFIDERSRETGKRMPRWGHGSLFGENLYNYQINFQTVMFRRRVLNEIETPYFDPELGFSPDYDLIMRILSRYPALSYPEPLVRYRKVSNSLTKRTIHLWGVEGEYTYKKLERLGLLHTNSTPEQRKRALAKFAYYKACFYASKNRFADAREVLIPYMLVDYRYFSLFLLGHIPWLWNKVHQLKA